MNTLTLPELIVQAEQIMLEKEYSSHTIKHYSNIWKQYNKYCFQKNISEYSKNLRKEFFINHYHFNLNDNLTKYQKSVIKALDILENISNGLPIDCKFSNKKEISITNIDIYNNYIDYITNILTFSKSTIRIKNYAILKFLKYLDNKKLIDVNINEVYSFINTLDNYSIANKSLIVANIKLFFNYGYKNNFTTINGNDLFPSIKSNQKSSLISYYSEEEVRRILSCVNTSTKTGKRDYLVLVLAIQLGIRANDIIQLKLNDIKWHENRIVFIQSKTQKLLVLPLSENIKFALLDYLKNVRPTSNEPYIFLRLYAPHTAYKSRDFHYIPKKYISIAHLEKKDRKKGLHSFRHSLASNLLLNNTPLPIITGILGHSNINTTNVYLSIDIINLRKLSLEVPYEE